MGEEPVDGFTVTVDDGRVVLTFTSRYGSGEEYYFKPEDAIEIGKILVAMATTIEERG